MTWMARTESTNTVKEAHAASPSRLFPSAPREKFLRFWNKTFFCSFIQQCFISRPSESTLSEDAGIESWTVATATLPVRRSNHLATWMLCAYVVVPYWLLYINLKLSSRKLSHIVDIWSTFGAISISWSKRDKGGG